MRFDEIWNKYTQSPGLSDCTLAYFDAKRRYFIESYLDKGGRWVGMLVIYPESGDGNPICREVCWRDDEDRAAVAAKYVADGIKLILQHAEEMDKNGTNRIEGTLYGNGRKQRGMGDGKACRKAG
jgi:hypothetical protein